ncbi:Cof-type HAD-IIB family hydrolase [Corynebacterium choanae]|uniref:Sugar phosphatase YidA n=1 Tax=Corynebacterium choanae TaxID=1862358 RepID=A0A3G6J3P0_9CORY|nr:Cof-type HAD-IIB family hydrolase [Corynebacterium choanae]AZA12539.1 Sugar phosphatase YidA [Corynebacterium choanae]
MDLSAMPTPQLVASDLDGTLLNDQERITDRTRAALQAARKAGATVVLATGRPTRWMRPVLEQLDFHPHVICANGALVVDTAKETIVASHRLAPQVLATIIDQAKQVLPTAGLSFAVELGGDPGDHWLDGGFLVTAGYRPVWSDDPVKSPPITAPIHDDAAVAMIAAGPDYQPDGGMHRSTRGVSQAEDSNDTVVLPKVPAQQYAVVSESVIAGAPAVKLLIRQPALSSQDMFEALSTVIGDDLCELTYSIHSGLIEISAAGVNKRQGLEDVVSALGLDPAATIAFGDMPNDVAMLTYAGVGVAMGNACEQAQAAADLVTGRNSDDGVAQVLEVCFPQG